MRDLIGSQALSSLTLNKLLESSLPPPKIRARVHSKLKNLYQQLSTDVACLGALHVFWNNNSPGDKDRLEI
jgi:hypothetical protein